MAGDDDFAEDEFPRSIPPENEELPNLQLAGIHVDLAKSIVKTELFSTHLRDEAIRHLELAIRALRGQIE